MKIVWTPEAIKTFDEILNYLQEEFSQKEVDTFYFETERVIGLIQKNPYLFKKSTKENIHQAVLHKYTTLYFEVKTSEKMVILLSFFETRQNPNKRKFL